MAEPGRHWIRAWEYSMLMASIPGFDGLEVLDVGCGNSTLCLVLQKLGSRVTTMDLPAPYDGVGRSVVEEKNRAGINQVWSSMLEIPFKDNTFDLVISVSAIEHLQQSASKHSDFKPYDRFLEDSRAALLEMARVIRPGGRLFLTTEIFDPDRVTGDAWSGRSDMVCSYAWPDWEEVFIGSLRQAGVMIAPALEMSRDTLLQDGRRRNYRDRYNTTFALMGIKDGTEKGGLDSRPKSDKDYYYDYHDRILAKRYNSPFWTRRYAHRRIHNQFFPRLDPGKPVFDAGCGEGVLTCLAAKQGFDIIGVDISAPNIEAACGLADQWNVRAKFVLSDLECLPFDDDSFDQVISSHVLEHLPDIDKGLGEIHRVTRDLALIAMPTCLNPCCWVMLGGSDYWSFTRRAFLSAPMGLLKTIAALARGEEGPDEGYGEDKRASHIWRFPWVMRRRIENAGFRIERFEAGPLIVPFLGESFSLVRTLQPRLDSLGALPVIRNLGFGSMAVCRKQRR
jgi:ubiquinone/menaquinone biosynthesis C-methylase UbiE